MVRVFPRELLLGRSGSALLAPPAKVADALVARQRFRLVLRGRNVLRITADEARSLGLCGWVRNLDSGAVEAVFEGPRTRVVDMIKWCEDGPPGAYVRDVRVSWDEPVEHLPKFEIRPTGYGPELA